MSISTSQTIVDGTPVALATANGMPLEVHIHAKGSVYVGNASVSTSNGLQLDNGDKITFTVPDGSALYGIAAQGTVTVGVLVAVL